MGEPACHKELAGRSFFQRWCWGSIMVGYLGAPQSSVVRGNDCCQTQSCWCFQDFSQERERSLPANVANSLFQWIPEECMGFFPWLCTLVSLQQRWKKAIQMSNPILLSLPGSQVKKDLFMTVLIFSVTFYWPPVLSWDRELVSLLFLVWSDKLVPLPWDWTMDKNQFSFNKLQQFAFSFSCCLYWFPEFSETLSILLRSRFIWKGTVMMATVPQESVFCLPLALLRAKPRRFIPSVMVCRETLEAFTALRHDSSELLSLQLSHLSGPAKESYSEEKNRNTMAFSWWYFSFWSLDCQMLWACL